MILFRYQFDVFSWFGAGHIKTLAVQIICIPYHGSSDVRGLEISQNAVVHDWAMASAVFIYCIYRIYRIYRMQQLIVS